MARLEITQEELDALERASIALYNVYRRNGQREDLRAAYIQLRYATALAGHEGH